MNHFDVILEKKFNFFNFTFFLPNTRWRYFVSKVWYFFFFSCFNLCQNISIDHLSSQKYDMTVFFDHEWRFPTKYFPFTLWIIKINLFFCDIHQKKLCISKYIYIYQVIKNLGINFGWKFGDAYLLVLVSQKK